jgi:hypothetical protein
MMQNISEPELCHRREEKMEKVWGEQDSKEPV